MAAGGGCVRLNKKNNKKPKTAPCMQFRGHGFLYKMVRHIAGAVIAVGRRDVTLVYIETYLRDGLPDKSVKGQRRGWDVAAACGLNKYHVEYPEWQSDDELLHADVPGHQAEAEQACAAGVERDAYESDDSDL
jgi:tRNA U38,U39,U40 pseudouridine synthase TruA